MRQALASVSRVLGRLAPGSTSTSDRSGAPPKTEHFDSFRRAAAQLIRRDGVERLVPIGVCTLLVLAALVSSMPEVSPASAAVRPSGQQQLIAVAVDVPQAQFGVGDGPLAKDSSDLYLGDGSISNTLQLPGVGTDAKTLLRTYTVQAGDTLNLIAGRYDLATSTLYWANKAALPDPASIRIGQGLLVPPMDGLLVQVGAKDTLDSLATKYKVSAQDIVDANNLPEITLTVGQTLIIPGASGGPMPASRAGTRAPSSGGWLWPVSGYNYISQYFWSGHHAVDIAASYGTPVVAAVGGTVVRVGWNGYTGGGNVVWVMSGTKLYTTYNHLSSWSVRTGQKVSAGQRLGLVGATGEATGPHLHFEVWLGYPWGLGNVSDAVNPCAYLAGC